QLAKALDKLGVQQGDCMGTMAWNGYRHVEIYYAVSGMGAICHTINPRLFPEQVIYIANHAEDKYIFTDLTFVPLFDKLAEHLPNVKGYIVMTDEEHMPETSLSNVICYESLMATADDDYQWPTFDERTASSLCYTSGTSGNPRDLQTLSVSLAHIPALREDLSSLKTENFQLAHLEKLHPLPALLETRQTALVDEPPANVKDGNIIQDGHSEELDELRSASRSGKDWIARLQQDERKRTGIDSLKIKFNNVFGYFIEITKTHIAKVPDDYTRKQTMANAERYITPALKEMENKVLGAEERSKQLEYELFLTLRQEVVKNLKELQETAAAIAEIDTLCALAETAQLHRHNRPILTHGTELIIENGRHPVLEQTLIETKFVPNDTELLPESSRLQILTGPNMAGKSTYIRQLALITLMAQIGAYVPADSATIGLTDRIFCRVGASDDISRGQSTFMVEMSETALILNHATEKSLVILDEIGRGTATFDGLSIAWAVAEHLHDETKCRTLFATHYHELTDLSNTRDAVVNCNVAVREWNEEIIFLHKILPGSADKSYGIQVARLAGLPKPVLARAKAILSHLEMNATKPTSKDKHPKPKTTKLEDNLPEANSPQMNLFDF
ncbi:MAG: DNA mismatch repair protein MutS, partial [Luteolibacter sp.]